MAGSLKTEAADLLEFARVASPSTAEVVGDHLDNVIGNHVNGCGTEPNQEFVVRLRAGEAKADLNLANLIALATLGATTLLADEEPAPDPRTHTTSIDGVPAKEAR